MSFNTDKMSLLVTHTHARKNNSLCAQQRVTDAPSSAGNDKNSATNQTTDVICSLTLDTLFYLFIFLHPSSSVALVSIFLEENLLRCQEEYVSTPT